MNGPKQLCNRIGLGCRPRAKPESRYNDPMKRETLTQANPHLQDAEKARRNRVRSLASSTAIETGEPIPVIEEKLNRRNSARYRIALA
jgi:hypothetical protein